MLHNINNMNNFPNIVKWNTLEQELKKLEIFNNLTFNMFIFYRKLTRRCNELKEEGNLLNIGTLNIEIEKVLINMSNNVDNLLDIHFIMDKMLIELLFEIVKECSIKTHTGLPFGIFDGGEKLNASINRYIEHFKKD